ncbi:hypothetical protein KUTeg_009052 [Tegillarca granosa]|uniref:Uncharacterized protein n=1 Tax=Tegillarca granosa TaxID=220873 RepID=A0ABQ9F7W5_TEGGR|nr:hypothetical protein KUTeg_009052 [Tegillarca granosa]
MDKKYVKDGDTHDNIEINNLLKEIHSIVDNKTNILISAVKNAVVGLVMWKKILAMVVGVLIGYWLIDDFNPDVIKGKRIVITGASTGIGEQMAYHFAKMGANILVTARREHALQQVVSRCKEINPNGQYYYISADMLNMTSTYSVINEAKVKLGGIDYLVLNHIIVIPMGVWQGTVENLTLMDKIIDVNFKAYVHLASHAIPYLQESQGHIIVVSSLSGKLAQPFTAVYSASKFALDGFFSGLRQEFLMKRTENSIKGLRNFGQDYLIENVQPAKPEDAAMAIIKGGAQRAREIHFPYMGTRLVTLFRDFFPGEAFQLKM